MKTLLSFGTSDVAQFVALRPHFDVCYVIDDDETIIDYLASLFKFDPLVHLTRDEPSSLDLQQFCADRGIDEIDTLVLSFVGPGSRVPRSLGRFLRKKRVRVVECLLGDEDSRPVTAGRGPGISVDALSRVFGVAYQRADTARGDGSAACIRWLRKGRGYSPVGNEKKSGPTTKKQFLFDLVYCHLRDKDSHVARRGNVSVIVSSAPQEGCDLYVYCDPYSYRGKQQGFDVLFVSEPFVVCPGSYNEDIWNHFDHIFTYFDALAARDKRFTKILLPRGGWAGAPVTEGMTQRERLYPLQGRRNAISMINGNKCSWVSGELYSKRVEAALWFYDNSDIPFEVYGRPPFFLPNYKGEVADGGTFSLLSRYKYNWCFENIDHPVFASGYVDKILDCLETRTVPIYLGNPNIGNYVPKECFIDFRDFGSYGAVNDYIHSITDDEYRGYIEHIDRWVSRGGLRPYSYYTLYDHLIRYYATQTGIDLRSLTGDETSWERHPIAPGNGVTQQPLWSFDEIRFRPSQFMDPEDLLKASPRERLTVDLNDRFQRTLGLASQQKYSEALREIALSGFAFNANHHLVCAQLMQLNGLQDPAFVQLSIALALNPGHSYAHNQLGVLCFQKNELAKAEEEFRKAVDLDSANHLARKNLAFLLLQTGRKREAMPMIKIVEPYFTEEVRGWKL